MDSRREAGAEPARLPAVSRRTVIAGTSGVAAAGWASRIEAAMPDERTRRFRLWLALTDQIERLLDRWASLEGWLVREHGWLQLSPAERQKAPWTQELRDIDAGLDVLFKQRDGLLEYLPASGCVNMDSVVTKLAVVERLIWPDDHPEAHALIVGARQDLIALSARTNIG